MITSQQLIERLQAIQRDAGCAVYVAIDLGNGELPDVTSVRTATDHGQTEETIAVLQVAP